MHYYLFPKRKMLILAFFSLLLSLLVGSNYYGEAVNIYVENEVKSYANNLILEIITTSIKDMQYDNLFIVEFKENNDLSYAYLDTTKVNSLLLKVKSSLPEIKKKLNNHEKFNTLMIPLGYFFTKNLVLSNGIKIPIKINTASSIEAQLDSNVTSYGINSSLLKLFLNITVNLDVILPLQNKKINYQSHVPLSLQIINGEVPEFYFPALSDGNVIIPN